MAANRVGAAAGIRRKRRLRTGLLLGITALVAVSPGLVPSAPTQASSPPEEPAPTTPETTAAPTTAAPTTAPPTTSPPPSSAAPTTIPVATTPPATNPPDPSDTTPP